MLDNCEQGTAVMKIANQFPANYAIREDKLYLIFNNEQEATVANNDLDNEGSFCCWNGYYNAIEFSLNKDQ